MTAQKKILSGVVLSIFSVFILGGRLLVAQNNVEKADAIIVLSGMHPDRPKEAALMQIAGYGQKIVLTRPALMKHEFEYIEEGISIKLREALFKEVLAKHGVSLENIIVLEPPVNNTFEEALVFRGYAMDNNIRSVIVITSKYHTRRAAMTFRGVLGEGIKVYIRGSRFDSFNEWGWWKDPGSAERVLHEYIGLLYYCFRLIIYKGEHFSELTPNPFVFLPVLKGLAGVISFVIIDERRVK